MIKQVKNWLGIEGVKMTLEIPESVKKSDKTLAGRIILSSKTDQQVSLLEIELLEKYVRGRGDNKKIDTFSLGAIKGTKSIKIPANKPVAMDFELPFEPLHSEMDQYAGRNVFYRSAVKTFKWVSAVKSTYTVYAKAKVKGVALDPFAEKTIQIV